MIKHVLQNNNITIFFAKKILYITNIIRKCKKDFYTKSLDNNKSIKSTWSILNSLINTIQKNHPNISVLDIHGKEIKYEAIANTFNEYFTLHFTTLYITFNEHLLQVGSKLDKNICSPNISTCLSSI